MNREIKFRGKDCIGNWWYGNLVVNRKITDEKTIENYTITGIVSSNFCTGIIPKTVGQFTGLHDKNGVEIYEGDILKVDTGYNIHFTHIQFDQERGAWHRFQDYGIGKLVGNIHDNPELLTEK